MAAKKKARNTIIIVTLIIFVIATVTYTAITQSQQYAKQPGASPTASTGITINPNATAAPGSSIYINEIMSGNKTAVLDDQGQYSDWFELYNPNDAPVDMTGWGLSDNQKKPIEWTFPNIQIPTNGYILVYCSGKAVSVAGKPLHANFRLSSKGDAIILTDNKGAIVDQLEVPAMDANTSYGRTPADPSKWAQFTKFTPGFSNDDNGYAQYIASLQLPADQKPPVVLNEVMAKNTTILKDDAGQYSDWVEITNTGSSDVSLKGFGLSDSDANPMKWKFPDISIKPGEFIVVFCSGTTSPPDSTDKKALHAPFRVGSYEGVIVLSDTMGRVIDRVTTKELGSDMSYARRPEGWTITSKPTPGYANTDAGYTDFTKANPVALGDVVISEASNTNISTVASAKGNYYDWLEIHNTSNHAVNLKDYSLTDNTANPTKWRFPDKTVEAGAYLTVFASGVNVTDPSQPLHTNFKLNSTSEDVALFDKDAKLLDRVPVENLRANMSVGRKDGDTGFFYFTTATPGSANSGGARETLPMPVASVPSGKYKTAQKITLTTVDGAKIYYTIDGSDPTPSSTLYTGEIPVIPQEEQMDNGIVPAGTVIRAIAAKDGYISSGIMTQSYFIGVPETLAIVSLTSDPKGLWDTTTGIMAKGPNAAAAYPYSGANFWSNTERPVHFEFIDENGKLGVGADAAIRMAGQFSRGQPKQAFSIMCRTQYGYSSIDYPFFATRTNTSYKDLVVRASGQESLMTGIRDVLTAQLGDGQLNCDLQAYRQCVVFIDGKYYGIYALREKINEHMIAQKYSVDPASVDMLKYNGKDSEIIAGTNKDWKTLMDFIDSHDLSVKENYDYVASQVDLPSYMDYVISEMYLGNTDLVNVKYWKLNTPGSKWHFILYDFCWIYWSDDTVSTYLNPEGCGVGKGLKINRLAIKLLQNADFKKMFLERFATLLKTTYSTDRVLSTIDQIVKTREPEMKYDRIKYPKDYAGGSTGTGAQWRTIWINPLKKKVQAREGVVLWSIQKYFGLSNDQMTQLFGSTGKAPATTATPTPTPKKTT